MNYVFALALVAPTSTYGERNYLRSSNRIRSNVRGIANNRRPVIHEKTDKPPRRRSVRVHRRDLRNGRLLEHFPMSSHDESSTSIMSTDFTSSEANMSLSTVISSTLSAGTGSADLENIGGIFQPGASMSMNVSHDTELFSLSMLSSEDMETVNSVTSLSMPESREDSYFSIMLLPSTEKPIDILTPFTSLPEEAFEEYESIGEYIYCMSLSMQMEGNHASLVMPSLEEVFSDDTEKVDMSVPMDDQFFHIPAEEEYSGLSLPVIVSLSMNMQQHFDGIEIPHEKEDGLDGIGAWRWTGVNMAEVDHSMSLSLSTTSDIVPTPVSFSMSVQEEGFDDFEIFSEEDNGISGFSVPAKMSFSYSAPDAGMDGIGDWWWTEFSMAQVDHSMSFSLSITSNVMPIVISSSMSKQEQALDTSAEEDKDLSGFNLPAGVSFSFSIPDDGMDGIGDWWWMEFSMAEVDRSMSLSLFPSDMSMFAQEQGFDEFEILPEEDTDLSEFSLPAEVSFSFSIPDDGMDEILWLTESSIGEVVHSMSGIAGSLSMNMEEEGFDEFEIPPEEDKDFSGFSLPAEESFSFSFSEDGMDGIGDWWWTEFSMAEVDRSMSGTAVSLSTSMQEEGFDEFEILPEEDNDFSGFNLPAEVSFSFKSSVDGMDSIGDLWWTEFSMAEVDRSMSLSPSPSDVPIVASLSMSVQEEGFDEFEIPPEEDNNFSGFNLPAEASFSFGLFEDGMDSIGDLWWTEFSMAEVDRSMSLSLSIPINIPSQEQSGTDFEAVENFSNDVEEFYFPWVY